MPWVGLRDGVVSAAHPRTTTEPATCAPKSGRSAIAREHSPAARLPSVALVLPYQTHRDRPQPFAHPGSSFAPGPPSSAPFGFAAQHLPLQAPPSPLLQHLDLSTTAFSCCRSALHQLSSRSGTDHPRANSHPMTRSAGVVGPTSATNLPCSSGQAAAAPAQPLNGVSNAEMRTRSASVARMPVTNVALAGLVGRRRRKARRPAFHHPTCGFGCAFRLYERGFVVKWGWGWGR